MFGVVETACERKSYTAPGGPQMKVRLLTDGPTALWHCCPTLKEGTAMSHDWTIRWKGLIFAGYGVMFALVLNKFVFDGPGWSKFPAMLLLGLVFGVIGHRIGRKQMRDKV
jgi:hypothetical protein